MESVSKDSVVTIAALGLLAYVSADVAHHVLGHGGACLAMHGNIESISSVHVQCSVTGSAVDLAGPLANLIVGVGAWLAARLAACRLVATHLFCTLVAAFNLFWFGMQLVYSATTKTDDWAWAMQQYHAGEPARYGMIALGIAAYVLAVRVVGHQLAPFGEPVGRARIIVFTAWAAAGVIATLTAALDHGSSTGILPDAVAQSLLLPIGLLFAPAQAARSSIPQRVSSYLRVSIPWIFTAGIVGALSVALLRAGLAEARAQETAPAQEEATAAEHAVEFQEETYLVPVNLPGGRTAQLHARLCRPPGEKMARLVVINHGTPPKPADRKTVKLGSCDQEAAQWFLRRGYAVAFALRRGYGETGGIDEENADCRHADFIRAGLQSVLDVDAVVRYTSNMPFVQPTDVIVVGQSTGGWATIAYNSVPHPKVKAFINMAGGRGGHHDDLPNHNCRPDLLVDAAKYFGKTATTPMLWIYTANDSFFDPHLAASMWRAFTNAGGKGEFDPLGPYGKDGHRLFFGKGGSQIWGPLVEHYLE